MTSYERASQGYDEEFQHALAEAITRAIFETSTLSDANAIAIRTSETADALIHVLALTLALSPPAARSRTAIRRTVDQLGKRLLRLVRDAEQNHDLKSFASGCFRNYGDVGGNA